MSFKNRLLFFLAFSFILPRNPLFSQAGNDALSDVTAFTALLEGSPPDGLSYNDIRGLHLIREEEKITRDLFLSLAARWSMGIFRSLAESEDNQAILIRTIMERHSINDQYETGETAKFRNRETQSIYDGLAAKSSRSPEEAIRAALFTQDLGIYELRSLIRQTERTDLKILYLNLEKSARSAIRALNSELERRGAKYRPLFIDMDLFNLIVSDFSEKKGIVSSSWYWYGKKADSME